VGSEWVAPLARTISKESEMSDIVKTVKVKPWGKDQGDFVEINAEDFDEKVHKELSAAELKKLEADEADLAAPEDAPPSASEDAVAEAAGKKAKA